MRHMNNTQRQYGPKPKPDRAQHFTMRGDPKVLEHLKLLAEQRGVYVSDLYRAALKAYAKKYGYEEE